MKKFFIIILSLVLTLTIQAQGKPASFMGIPVSGSSNSMHEALTKKGFKKNDYGTYNGKYLGRDVTVHFVTNSKGEVWRLLVVYGRADYELGDGLLDFDKECRAIAIYNECLNKLLADKNLKKEKAYGPISYKEDEAIYSELNKNPRSEKYSAHFLQGGQQSAQQWMRLLKPDDGYAIYVFFDSVSNK
jgi:hypothetical protein